MSQRNLIYTCVFANDKYTALTIELLRSFFISNPTDNGVDFLVYTNKTFSEQILSSLSDISDTSRLKFHINNYYNTINQSRISKVDIFDYKELHNYQKVLYLDTDSYISGSLNQLFDSFPIEKTSTMFVVPEGNVLSEAEYWGRSLFLKNGKTIDHDGFSASMFAFINIDSGNIKKMFLKIKQQFFLDMYQGKLIFYDQPYLNYNFYESGLCEIEMNILGRLAFQGARKYNSQYIIHHFSGCPGNYDVKSGLLTDFKKTIPTKKNIVAIVANNVPFEIRMPNIYADYLCFMNSVPESLPHPWQYVPKSDFLQKMDSYEVFIVAKHEAYIPMNSGM